MTTLPLGASRLDDRPAPSFRMPPEWIAPRGDLDSLERRFKEQRRVLVSDVLDAGVAQRLHSRVSSWRKWALVTRIEATHRSFDAAGMEALDAGKRATFDELVAREARAGFQYLYERFPLYDHGRAGRLDDSLLLEMFALLRSEDFLALARRITGNPAIRFADGQLTRYRRGHFLTLHDDRADGLGRLAAFVLNLTLDWAADFGGQLQFVGAHGQVEEVVTPKFNLLTVFEVPCPHLVSVVAPFVTGARLAITGWFRGGEEPV